ncbi:MAG: hypothetical protein GYA51_07115 [Candidatus Methanofastidiosa archaeon]|nr:hypothetical protein [Candidatus Methanofastidiosa archaeon]
MKKWISIITIFVVVLLFGCGPNQSDIQLMLADTISAIPSYTPYPTYTYYPTQTPIIIIYTATVIPTATIIPTPTTTPIPFNKSQCENISIPNYSSEPDYQKELREHLRMYEGQCVELFFEPWESKYGKSYMFGILSNYIDSFDIDLLTDTETPNDITIPSVFSIVWGILEVPENDSSPVKLTLRDVEEYPYNQQPISEEGLYYVGKDSEMYPGVWKSANEPTWTNACYWARLNPSSGVIKANHFGIAGMTVRVYEGEIFETNDECVTWYFVKP